MNPKVEIFSQGEEVITGQVADTNAAWLSQQLVSLGFQVSRHTAVGDKMADLIGLLKEIASRADCCICSGGLGPTSDDLTAEAVAQAFNLPLQFDEVALQQISGYFARRNIAMPEVNRKQAMLPQGATRIDNEWGTAPGFCLQYQHCWFVFLPGVPFEMQHLFTETVRPDLEGRFSLQPEKLVIIKTWGIGESALQAHVNQIEIPAAVTVSYRAGVDENQTKLLFPHDYPPEATSILVQQVAAQIGDAVFAIDGLDKTAGDLVSVIADLLNQKSQTLAVIESASQGLIAAKCIGHDWLVSSSYNQKLSRLNQSEADLINTAKRLGRELQKSCAATFALVQFYDGSEQAFADKNQTITLCSVLLTEQGFCQQSKTVAGTLQRKQNQAALYALDLLRRFLQQKESFCPYYD